MNTEYDQMPQPPQSAKRFSRAAFFRRRPVVLLLLSCLPWLAMALIALFGVKRDIPLPDVPAKFDANRAAQTTREFVTQFPMRLFGSLESRQSTGYLTDKLTAMGYKVEYEHFDGRIGKSKQAGRNVLAFKQGETDEILAITAYYDTARPTVQGAAKNGAAVGVLIELAELFSRESTHRSLLFALTDGGEWGATGARDIIYSDSRKDRIVAALSLDYVVPDNPAGFRLDETGQSVGFTPVWLRQTARSAAAATGLPVAAPSGIREFLERTFYISRSEQGPFLQNGIPAVNLGSFSADENRENEIIYSSEDTEENLQISGIEKYGIAAEWITRALDGLPQIPPDAVDGFRTQITKSPNHQINNGFRIGSRFVNLSIIAVLNIFLFLPLCRVLPSGGFQKSLNRTQIGREILAFSITLIPFLALYFGIRLAHMLRQFPLYDLYPAVAKDPVMLNPSWKALFYAVGAAVFIAVAAWVIGRYMLKEWTKPDFTNSRIALIGLLFIIAAIALCYNTFWAVVFLAAPAWLWPTIENSPGYGKKILNIVLIAAAGIPGCLALVWLATQLGFGWNFFWYQTLALTTGLFSPYAYFMSSAAIAVGLRLIAVASLKTDESA